MLDDQYAPLLEGQIAFYHSYKVVRLETSKMLGNQAYKSMKYQDVDMDMILVFESRQTSLLTYRWCTCPSGRSFHVSAL